MARRSKRESPEELRQELIKLLETYEGKLKDESLRAQVQCLIPANHALRDLGSSLITEDEADSARDRILTYLRAYPQVVLHGDELMVVAGISEYARRIRELRKEHGWPVLSGQALKDMADDDESFVLPDNADEIKTDYYFLLENSQDREAAFRWNIANDLRKSDLSVKDKFLAYFRQNVGKRVTGEELKYLAKGKSEWPRRVRELRTEEGWPIVTCNSGMPGLPVGVYVLETDRQAEIHDRRIPDIVRIQVLERDQYSCRNCSWNPDTRSQADRFRNLIELHHIEHHVHGGENVLENLICLCNVCHDEVHRGGITAGQLLAILQ